MLGDKNAILPILKKSTLVAGMTDEEICELLDSTQVTAHTYSKGEIIFHEGEMPHSLYILLEGEIHIQKDTFSGRQIFLSEINEPGDMFGEIYQILAQPYDMYVEAATKIKVLELSSELFSLDSPLPENRSILLVQRNLMRIFARKAYFMHNKLKVLASGSLREKIVRFLYQGLDKAGCVAVGGNREYLAAYLAVTRPSVSRELSAMQREGLIEMEGKKIRVLDIERFEEYL